MVDDARIRQAAAAEQAGRPDEARRLLHAVLSADPRSLPAWKQLGLLELRSGRAGAAADSLGRACALDKRAAGLAMAHGAALAAAGRPEEAIRRLRQALKLKPDLWEAHSNLAGLLRAGGRIDEALASMRRAIALCPNRDALLRNHAAILCAAGRHDEAQAMLHDALRQRPASVELRFALGTTLTAVGEHAAALPELRAAVAADPAHVAAHRNLAYCLLALGEFAAGWAEYEWRTPLLGEGRAVPLARWCAGTLPRLPAAGRPTLSGRKVVLLTEQGIGDELFFLRFLPRLRAQGANVALRLQPPLAALIERAVPEEVGTIDRDVPTSADHTFLLGDLPHLLGMRSAADVPPALRIDPRPDHLAATRTLLARADARPWIAVTWRAGADNVSPDQEELAKRIDPAALGMALRGWHGEVVSVQRNPAPGEMDALARALGRPVHDCSDRNRDLEAMAALLALVDDYVGVSNTNMHLRASVGGTGRVLVPLRGEWRWMAAGVVSPWFPQFRIHREERTGGWDRALAVLADDLAGRATPAAAG